MNIKENLLREFGSICFASKKLGINRNTLYKSINSNEWSTIIENKLKKQSIDPETLKPFCRKCGHVKDN